MKYTFIVVDPNKKSVLVDKKSEVNDPSQSACTNTNNNSSPNNLAKPTSLYSNALVTYSTDKSVKFRNITSESLGGTVTPVSTATNLKTHNHVANSNTPDTDVHPHNSNALLIKNEIDTLDNNANNHNNNVNNHDANHINLNPTPLNNITNSNTSNNTAGPSSKSNYTNASVPTLNTTSNYVPVTSVDDRPIVWTVGAIWTLLKLMRNVNGLLLTVNDPPAELYIWQKLVKLFEAQLIKEQLADPHFIENISIHQVQRKWMELRETYMRMRDEHGLTGIGGPAPDSRFLFYNEVGRACKHDKDVHPNATLDDLQEYDEVSAGLPLNLCYLSLAEIENEILTPAYRFICGLKGGNTTYTSASTRTDTVRDVPINVGERSMQDFLRELVASEKRSHLLALERQDLLIEKIEKLYERHAIKRKADWAEESEIRKKESLNLEEKISELVSTLFDRIENALASPPKRKFRNTFGKDQ